MGLWPVAGTQKPNLGLTRRRDRNGRVLGSLSLGLLGWPGAWWPSRGQRHVGCTRRGGGSPPMQHMAPADACAHEHASGAAGSPFVRRSLSSPGSPAGRRRRGGGCMAVGVCSRGRGLADRLADGLALAPMEHALEHAAPGPGTQDGGKLILTDSGAHAEPSAGAQDRSAQLPAQRGDYQSAAEDCAIPSVLTSPSGGPDCTRSARHMQRHNRAQAGEPAAASQLGPGQRVSGSMHTTHALAGALLLQPGRAAWPAPCRIGIDGGAGQTMRTVCAMHQRAPYCAGPWH